VSTPPLVTGWYWAATANRGECREVSCRAPITMIRNAVTDKWMPFNGHDLTILRTDADRESGRTIWELDLADSHFVTCPAADRFRKRR